LGHRGSRPHALGIAYPAARAWPNAVAAPVM
ncbi:uncharacterized protein METZ01_LOCUS255721, partial [marine metagenome]